MARAAKVPLHDAERAKRALHAAGALDEAYHYDKDEAFLYFPVTKEVDVEGVGYVDRELEERDHGGRLRDLLKEQLSEEEYAHLKSAFDMVGSIAIVEVDDELREKEQLIARAVLENHKNIRTVLKKAGGHEGELRTQRMAFLAGEDTRETVVQENGVRLKVDVEQVYYSVRFSNERKRIASLVQPGERVLVMFSGVAPFPCVIAKHTEAAEVTGIELNEKGHELAKENAELNKLNNVVLIQGDVKDVVPELAAKGVTFDRVVMPLPHTGHDFLDEAFAVTKEGATIHLYDFEPEGEFEKAAEKAKRGAERNGREIEVLGVVASGQHSPRVHRVCCDFKIL